MPSLSRNPFGNATRSFYDSIASILVFARSLLSFTRIAQLLWHDFVRKYRASESSSIYIFSNAYRVTIHNYFEFRSFLLSFLSKSTSKKRKNVFSELFKIPIDEEVAQKGFNWEVKYNESPLWILGLWPLDNKFIHLKFTMCLSLMLAYSLPSIVRIVFIGSDGSVEGPLQIITEIAPLIYTMLQFSVFKHKSYKVKIILTKMYEDWGRSVNLNEEDKKPMMIYGGRTRAITAIGVGFFFISCVGYYAEPVLTMLIKGNSSTKSLPNKGLYPFETDRSPNYQIVYAMQAFIGVLCAVSLISIDGFLLLSSFHGCGQLAILCKMINRYEGQTRHVNTSSNDTDQKFENYCSCLKCIVDRHVSLIKYVKIIDDVFNGIIMARLILNTTHFCGVGYIIIKSNEKHRFFDLVLNLLYMGTMTINFFMYCWIGQQMLEEGENIGKAVYKLDWHNKEPEITKSLILPILHSRRPLKVTAGRFFIMSLSCFKEWFMNSVGYLSVLLAIKTHT